MTVLQYLGDWQERLPREHGDSSTKSVNMPYYLFVSASLFLSVALKT